MYKSILIFLFVFIFSLSCGISQKVSNIDFDEIKKLTQDKLSSKYYPTLMKRFKEFDTTLTENDFQLIYYGSVFGENYFPYGLSDDKSFFDAYYKEKYQEAIDLGLKLLEKDPINLKIIFKMLASYHILGNLDFAKKYSFIYSGLITEIYKSGDGISKETPFVVMKISDEYEILDANNLKSGSQALVGVTDVLSVTSKDPNKPFEYEELYFDVSKPLEHLSNQFKK